MLYYQQIHSTKPTRHIFSSGTESERDVAETKEHAQSSTVFLHAEVSLSSFALRPQGQKSIVSHGTTMGIILSLFIRALGEISRVSGFVDFCFFFVLICISFYNNHKLASFSLPREGNSLPPGRKQADFALAMKDWPSYRSWNCHLHCITWAATPKVQLCLQLQKEIGNFLRQLPWPGFEPGTSWLPG